MNQNKIKVLLLGATFGTDNMGVGALTMGALQVLSSSYPNADILFLDYGARSFASTALIEGKTVSIPLLNLRFSWKIFLPNNVASLLVLATFLRLAYRRPFWKRMLQRNPWLRKIGEADLAFALSGGDSFSDIYGFGRFFYVSLPQLLVVLLRRQLVLCHRPLVLFGVRYRDT